MGEFIKHITQHDAEHVEKNPFPESQPRESPEDDKYLQKKSGRKLKKSKGKQTHFPTVEEAHVKILQSSGQVISESNEIPGARSTDTNMTSLHEPVATFLEDVVPTESKEVGEIIQIKNFLVKFCLGKRHSNHAISPRTR